MGVPVVYRSWQYECCGDPFRVGDQVDWPLKLSLGGEPWMPHDWLIEAELQPTPEAGGHGVRVGHVLAYADEPIQQAARDRVIFYEEHHGEIPEEIGGTRGRVSGIQVVSVVFRDGRALSGTVEVREVDAVPEVFEAGAGREFRSEVGVLVDLEPASA